MFNLTRHVQALLPQTCLLCHISTHAASGVCNDCTRALPYLSADTCPQCGLSANGLVCGHCLHFPPAFDLTRAVFTYAFPINRLIQQYKYGHQLAIGHSFSHWLSKQTDINSVDCVIPMPMHPKRLQERGFNQALEIARHLSRQSPNKLDYTSVVRPRLSPPQASLPLKTRVKNMRGAFHTNQDFSEARVAIVDDVMTTGASLNALAETLKKAGASHVECWVIARTQPTTD